MHLNGGDKEISSKTQKSTLLKKNGSLVNFIYLIEVQAVTNWSSRLKNAKHLKFYIPHFPRFLKNISNTRKNH